MPIHQRGRERKGRPKIKYFNKNSAFMPLIEQLKLKGFPEVRDCKAGTTKKMQ